MNFKNWGYTAAVFLSLAFIGGHSHAKRTILHFPLDTPGSWTVNEKNERAGAAANWVGLERKVDLINISPIKQTVTIKLVDIEFRVHSCQSIYEEKAHSLPKFSSGVWKQGTNPDCWSIKHAVKNLKKSIVLNPKESKNVSLGYQCQFYQNKSPQCTAGAPNLKKTTTLHSLSLGSAEGRIVIKVDEDRGAIKANVRANPTSRPHSFIHRSFQNVPINGGRAF